MIVPKVTSQRWSLPIRQLSSRTLLGRSPPKAARFFWPEYDTAADEFWSPVAYIACIVGNPNP